MNEKRSEITITIRMETTGSGYRATIPEVPGSHGFSNMGNAQEAITSALRRVMASSVEALAERFTKTLEPMQIRLGHRYRSVGGGEWLCYRIEPSGPFPASCVEVNRDNIGAFTIDGRYSCNINGLNLVEEIKP